MSQSTSSPHATTPTKLQHKSQTKTPTQLSLTPDTQQHVRLLLADQLTTQIENLRELLCCDANQTVVLTLALTKLHHSFSAQPLPKSRPTPSFAIHISDLAVTALTCLFPHIQKLSVLCLRFVCDLIIDSNRVAAHCATHVRQWAQETQHTTHYDASKTTNNDSNSNSDGNNTEQAKHNDDSQVISSHKQYSHPESENQQNESVNVSCDSNKHITQGISFLFRLHGFNSVAVSALDDQRKLSATQLSKTARKRVATALTAIHTTNEKLIQLASLWENTKQQSHKAATIQTKSNGVVVGTPSKPKHKNPGSHVVQALLEPLSNLVVTQAMISQHQQETVHNKRQQHREQSKHNSRKRKIRSLNPFIDSVLREEGGSTDNYADLEDFIVVKRGKQY
eukprot:c9519_g2_i1.p1 GENE.c9519_g2_i1~~c9519_g2_i1.p1  ORF type:complete len:394 (+),score=99.39 c9519_g2_i1:1-1182(+)